MDSKEFGNVLEMVAEEVRKCMSMLSSCPEGECLRHAVIGQRFLQELGVETRLVIG